MHHGFQIGILVPLLRLYLQGCYAIAVTLGGIAINDANGNGEMIIIHSRQHTCQGPVRLIVNQHAGSLGPPRHRT